MTDEYKQYREDVYTQVAERLHFTDIEAFNFGYARVIDYMISVIGPYDDVIETGFELEYGIDECSDKIIYNYTWMDR